jgi:hypothetical protein
MDVNEQGKRMAVCACETANARDVNGVLWVGLGLGARERRGTSDTLNPPLMNRSRADRDVGFTISITGRTAGTFVLPNLPFLLP